ncbi:MAG: 1-deoxy-D-xylulose-5-phosphate synthase, partial [Ruminococcus sp.]|nr:1-deoxy-D-xylulose-5-phosphate synthase [Ruminococcus sp.]
DQLIHDLAIMKSHAVICVDRAGIVGDDGETHQGIFDVAFLTTIPGVTIFSPSIYSELQVCLDRAVNKEKGLCVVRYPRGADRSPRTAPNTEYEYRQNGGDILLVTYGRLTDNVYKAAGSLEAEGIIADTLSLIRIFPIEEKIVDLMKKYKKVIFFEESYYSGCLAEKYSALLDNIESHAIYDFVPHGKPSALIDELGLSAEKMTDTVRRSVRNAAET